MENVAVIGASANEARYANKTMKMLAEYGLQPDSGCARRGNDSGPEGLRQSRRSRGKDRHGHDRPHRAGAPGRRAARPDRPPPARARDLQSGNGKPGRLPAPASRRNRSRRSLHAGHAPHRPVLKGGRRRSLTGYRRGSRNPRRPHSIRHRRDRRSIRVRHHRARGSIHLRPARVQHHDRRSRTGPFRPAIATASSSPFSNCAIASATVAAAEP